MSKSAALFSQNVLARLQAKGFKSSACGHTLTLSFQISGTPLILLQSICLIGVPAAGAPIPCLVLLRALATPFQGEVAAHHPAAPLLRLSLPADRQQQAAHLPPAALLSAPTSPAAAATQLQLSALRFLPDLRLAFLVTPAEQQDAAHAPASEWLMAQRTLPLCLPPPRLSTEWQQQGPPVPDTSARPQAPALRLAQLARLLLTEHNFIKALASSQSQVETPTSPGTASQDGSPLGTSEERRSGPSTQVAPQSGGSATSRVLPGIPTSLAHLRARSSLQPAAMEVPLTSRELQRMRVFLPHQLLASLGGFSTGSLSSDGTFQQLGSSPPSEPPSAVPRASATNMLYVFDDITVAAALEPAAELGVRLVGELGTYVMMEQLDKGSTGTVYKCVACSSTTSPPDSLISIYMVFIYRVATF